MKLGSQNVHNLIKLNIKLGTHINSYRMDGCNNSYNRSCMDRWIYQIGWDDGDQGWSHALRSGVHPRLSIEKYLHDLY